MAKVITSLQFYYITPLRQFGLIPILCSRGEWTINEFTISSSLQGKRLILDCGQVSSVAEPYVNDAKVGTAVWTPYRFDISKWVKPGLNRLKILVTNTEANRREVGIHRKILAKIDRGGLSGPVRIIPYLDEILIREKK